MNLATLSLAYLRDRSATMALNLVVLGLGIGTIVAVILFGAQLESRLTRDSRGFDLVVGAKGSPLQLILSTVYQADAPIGNVPIDEANAIAGNGLVATAIPLALGDNYRGYRIVGTEASYAQHYGARIAEGRLWQAPFEATLGAEAARVTGLGIGANFVGAHGVVPGGEARGELPYEVVGVLAPTGTVLDRLILTPVESVWRAQERERGEVRRIAGELAERAPEREITALLITYRTPMAAAMLPRFVNSRTALQAASPAYETARLLSLVGVGIDALRGFGILLIAAAALGVFLALYNATRERRYDIAIMRSLGASRGDVLCKVLLEGLLLASGGIVLALALGHGVAALLGEFSPEGRALGLSGLAWRAEESWLVVLAMLVGAASALIPALLAYRVDIAHTLARD
jgi:putative ABC transport system permease protein